jgi:hypothetical protein
MKAASSALRPGFDERQTFAARNWLHARSRGLVCQIAEDERFDGRLVTLNGRRLVNFATGRREINFDVHEVGIDSVNGRGLCAEEHGR